MDDGTWFALTPRGGGDIFQDPLDQSDTIPVFCVVLGRRAQEKLAQFACFGSVSESDFEKPLQGRSSLSGFPLRNGLDADAELLRHVSLRFVATVACVTQKTP